MRPNLDSMRSEIQAYLESRGIVVFHGYPRAGDPPAPVFWDTDRYPDYHMFLAAAEAAGVRLVTLYAREFTEDMIEDALEQLDSSDVPNDEQRAVEQRLRELRRYAGFTCQIELSFDLANRVYIFDLRTDWYDELSEMQDRIDDSYSEEEDEDEGPLSGGYYSKN